MLLKRNIQTLIIASAMTLLILSFQNCSLITPPQEQKAKSEDFASQSAEKLLETKAFRVIKARCIGCHNSANPGGGIDYLDNLDMLLFYRLVIPNEPQLSTLYNVVQSGEMPPSETLSNEESQDLYNWINDGFKSGMPAVVPPPNIVALEPKYSSIYAKIIQPKCLGCHSSNNARGGLSMSSYAATMNSIQAGNPGASSFYRRVSDGSMPQGGARLNIQELNVLSTWIQNGALNN